MSPSPPILVTGVAGFIGAVVARQLLERGHRVLGLDDLSAGRADRLEGLDSDQFQWVQGDVRDTDLVAELLREQPSAVLHLAARVGVRRVLEDPEGCEIENLDGARSLAQALTDQARAGHRPRVVAASTSEVYAPSSGLLSESSPLRSASARGRWRYAASKRVAEEILDRVPMGRRPLHLRFFNVVGPGQDASSGMVLPRFVEAAMAGRAVEVYGSGQQVRTFAHVEAVARDVAALVAPGTFLPGGHPVSEAQGALNIGGLARTTIAQLAETVIAESRSHSPVLRIDPRRAVRANFEEVRHRVPDLSRAEGLGLCSAELGSRPWSLGEIVRDTMRRHLAPQTTVSEPACASRAS